MVLYLETIPEDLLLEISLYLDQHTLLEVYKLFKPRLYDKPSFWYSRYFVNLPDVDWRDLVVDQKGYTFEMLFIIYSQYLNAYDIGKSLLINLFNKTDVFFYIDNIPFYLVVDIKLKLIKKLELLKFDHRNESYIIKSIYRYNDKVIEPINNQEFKLIDQSSKINVSLHIVKSNNNYYFNINALVYKVSHRDVLNMTVYAEFVSAIK